MSEEQKVKVIKWAQAVAIVVGAIGSMLGPAIGFVAYFRPPPEERLAAEAYERLRADVVQLQRWARDNREASSHAEESCQAEVDQVRLFVEGFTAGMAARKDKQNKTITSKPHDKAADVTVQRQVYRAPVLKRKAASLKELAPPPSLPQIQQQVKMQQELEDR